MGSDHLRRFSSGGAGFLYGMPERNTCRRKLFFSLFDDLADFSTISNSYLSFGRTMPGMNLIVEDDPQEPASLDADGNGTLRWTWLSCCTDGAVIGYFESGSCVSMQFLVPAGDDIAESVDGDRHLLWKRKRSRYLSRLHGSLHRLPRPLANGP